MKTLIKKWLEPALKNGVLDVPTALRKGRIISRSIAGVTVQWLITNSNDEIQSHQITHGFYELNELENLLGDIGPRTSILDVGANIGNHAVFFVKKMGCRNLIAAEPYPPAFRHLLVNLALNSCPKLNIRTISAALGAHEGHGNIVAPTTFNIGLTKVDMSAHGEVEIYRGDDLVGGEPVDLVKIDVEGMEVEVLAGLQTVLRKHRPAAYVEVGERTKSAVIDFAASLGYRVARDTSAYRVQSNLTLLPN